MYNKGLIIIPAYNESEKIQEVLESLSDNSNCLVIDDGSTDDTFNIIRKHDVLFIKNTAREGVSNCIRKGINYARKHNKEYIITLDADGQHDPAFIEKFINLVQRVDCVVGNRFADLTCVPSQKLTSNCFASKLIRTYFGICIPDVSCGFRGYRINKGMEQILFNTNQHNEYEIVYDILLKSILAKKEIVIVDIPCIYYPEELWCTRRQELLSLITVIQYYVNDSLLITILNNLVAKMSFCIQLDGTKFSFHFINEIDSYFIQAKVSDIAAYYKMLVIDGYKGEVN